MAGSQKAATELSDTVGVMKRLGTDIVMASGKSNIWRIGI